MPEIELDPAPGGSARLRAYLARPSGNGPWPAVVAIHEALGLNDIVRRQADRLAAAGYLTVAPNLFSDGGPRCVLNAFRSIMSGRGAAIADVDAAREFARAHPDSTGKVGIIGFCMGGGFALVTANRGFDAAAPNYGMLPGNAERVLRGACPIVASYGGKDLATRGVAGKIEKALTTLGVEHDVKQYPDAGHCFLNDAYLGPRPTHALQRIAHFAPEPEAARDAWARIEEFFGDHLSS